MTRFLKLSMAVLALAGIPLSASAQLQPEPLITHSYPEPSPHRIHVVSYEGVMERYYVIDGDSGQVLGLVPGAMNSVLRIGPDGHFYSSETYYEKLWRGKRTDQITVYDGRTGMVVRELEIPPKRLHSYSINSSFDFTEGGKYLLQYNISPAGSITVVDGSASRVIGEFPSAGCGLVFPYAPDAWVSLCSDGGLLRMKISDKGEISSESFPPFFDAEKDPVLQNSLVSAENDLALFVSYEALLYPLDLKARKPTATKPWSLRAKGEDDWFPTGWQPVAYNAKTDMLFVIMNQTVKWDHTAGGHEVWAFDRKSKKRLYRAQFEEPIAAIAVSPDAEPQLYALTNENESILYVLDAKTGDMLTEVEELGSYPFTMMAMPSFVNFAKP